MEENKNPEISVSDLIILAQVVQAASVRGAIKAEEMESVGAVYTKLVAFLEASGAVTRTDSTQTTEE